MKGKHIVADFDGVRCTVVEAGIPESRVQFISEILKRNKLEVKVQKDKAKDGSEAGTFTVGVTDLVFNPMIALYEHGLVRSDGKPVTPAYWNQWPSDLWELPYWSFQHQGNE